MATSFSTVIDRRNSHSIKWDGIAKLSGITAPDAIAMWVADMDFAAPAGVTAALREEMERATHGYYGPADSWHEAVQAWVKRRHDWTIETSWISQTPGIVSGLGQVIQATTDVGDEIVLFSPGYHAFRKIILANDRRILDSNLILSNGRYALDLDQLGRQISPRTKAVFFCSPHNPGGTVWSRDEIRALADFCIKRDLILVSDEIHNDLVFAGHKHIPTMIAAPECADRLITCVAATKTFNLAGAHAGALVTSNAALRAKIDARINANGLASYNSFGMLVTEAAWRTGESWLDDVLPYLAENCALFDQRIEAAVPGARSMRLASTYLAWVDFTGTDLANEDVRRRIAERARIFASPGPQFGPGGDGWMRFNLATPRPILMDALGRLEAAFADLKR